MVKCLPCMHDDLTLNPRIHENKLSIGWGYGSVGKVFATKARGHTHTHRHICVCVHTYKYTHAHRVLIPGMQRWEIETGGCLELAGYLV